MTAAATSPEDRPKRAPTLYFIVGFKLLKGIGALLLALGVYSLRDNNLPDEFDRLVEFLHVDPDNKFVLELADRVAQITPTNMNWVVILSVLYSLFVVLQAFGLMFRVTWIVWLVIGESAFFLPIEFLELLHKPSWVKLAIIALNVLIVWYLFSNRERLMKHHHHHYVVPPMPPATPAAPSASPAQPKAN
jgi:uncharacterized membrane protein (DUF2068 family)